MRIEVSGDGKWNDNRLTFIEHPSGLGDKVLICVHSETDDGENGHTVLVYASDLTRAAKMLSVPYEQQETPND